MPRRASKYEGAFIPGAEGEGRLSEGLVLDLIQSELTAGRVVQAQALVRSLQAQVAQGLHKNPGTLVVYGNPSRAPQPIRVGATVPLVVGPSAGWSEQIRYQRTMVPTGYYFHDHRPREDALSLASIEGQHVVLIVNIRGRPLWGTA